MVRIKCRTRDWNGNGMIICEQVLMTSLPRTPLCALSDRIAGCHAWGVSSNQISSLQREQLHFAQEQIRPIRMKGILSLDAKMICPTQRAAVFICNPKCAANFLQKMHGATGAHAHKVQIIKAISIQSCIHDLPRPVTQTLSWNIMLRAPILFPRLQS